MKDFTKRKIKTGYIKLGKLVRIDTEDEEWKKLEELKRPQRNRKRRVTAVR